MTTRERETMKTRLQIVLTTAARLHAALEDGDTEDALAESIRLQERLLELENIIGISTPAALFDM